MKKRISPEFSAILIISTLATFSSSSDEFQAQNHNQHQGHSYYHGHQHGQQVHFIRDNIHGKSSSSTRHLRHLIQREENQLTLTSFTESTAATGGGENQLTLPSLTESTAATGGGHQRQRRNWSPSLHKKEARNINTFNGNHIHATSILWDVSSKFDTTTPIPPEKRVFLRQNSTRELTAHIGSNVILDCKVKAGSQFGTITWARLEDKYRPYSVLTIANMNYVEDKRFLVVKPRKSFEKPESLNWALQIQRVRPEDGGLYECQATTHPPQSIVVKLVIVEAISEIRGTSEKIIKSGSTLQLNCVLKRTTEKPLYTFWYHNDRMINYDSDRGVSVETNKISGSSTLTLKNAKIEDAGNFTCSPYNVRPSSVIFHVLSNEGQNSPAAAISDNSENQQNSPNPNLKIHERSKINSDKSGKSSKKGKNRDTPPPSAAVQFSNSTTKLFDLALLINVSIAVSILNLCLR